MSLGPRGRGFGKDKVDVESLERENDRGLDMLAERVGLLKAATQGIKNEADSQHSILDNMGKGMVDVRSMLGSVNDKFKVVMSNKQNRNLTMGFVISVSLLILLWWFTRR